MHYYQSAISRGIFILPLIALIPLIPYYWKKRQRGIANHVAELLPYVQEAGRYDRYR